MSETLGEYETLVFTTEAEYAIREAEETLSEDSFFCARPLLDTPQHRKLFEAGFIRGWGKARPKYPGGLTGEQITAIAEGMPGGMDGFLKGWGWYQFAKAIEAAQGLPEETTDKNGSVEATRCSHMRRRDFVDMETLLKIGFAQGDVINVESIPYNDDSSRCYYRVWFWG